MFPRLYKKSFQLMADPLAEMMTSEAPVAVGS